MNIFEPFWDAHGSFSNNAFPSLQKALKPNELDFILWKIALLKPLKNSRMLDKLVKQLNILTLFGYFQLFFPNKRKLFLKQVFAR